MTIGQKLIKHIPLTLKEADEVFAVLGTLDAEGGWLPDWAAWAAELDQHLDAVDPRAGGRNSEIQLAAWKAVGRTYERHLDAGE